MEKMDNFYYVVIDNYRVFKKGSIQIGNIHIDRIELRKILQSIEEFYFAGLVNRNEFHNQVFQDLKTTVDKPIEILFNTWQQKDIISTQIDSPHFLPDYQNIPWISDICKLIARLTEFADDKYFNYHSISRRMDYVIKLYDQIDSRIMFHVRELFLFKDSLYEKVYNPNYDQDDVIKSMTTMNEIIFNDKIRLFSFEFNKVDVKGVRWHEFIEEFRNCVRNECFDDYMVALISIMFEFEIIYQFDDIIQYMNRLDEEHPDEYNKYVPVNFANNFVIKIKVKYTPLLKMLIGYVLLLKYSYYNIIDDVEVSNKENIEPILIDNEPQEKEFVENERQKILELIKNLDSNIKYHASVGPCSSLNF